MPEQESIHKLQTEIQTLKIKDEFRTKELDALMKKLSETSGKLNSVILLVVPIQGRTLPYFLERVYC